MADQSSCMSPSCGITIDGLASKCPRCGGLMRTSRTIRAFGWVMLSCCAACFLVMGWMALVLSRSSPMTGLPDEPQLTILIFVISFCLLASLNALYMVVTGRTSRALVKIMLSAVAILVVGTALVHRFLS